MGLGFGGGGGGFLVFFLTNWGGSNLFYSQPGEGRSFFLVRKKLLQLTSIPRGACPATSRD